MYWCTFAQTVQKLCTMRITWNSLKLEFLYRVLCSTHFRILKLCSCRQEHPTASVRSIRMWNHLFVGYNCRYLWSWSGLEQQKIHLTGFHLEKLVRGANGLINNAPLSLITLSCSPMAWTQPPPPFLYRLMAPQTERFPRSFSGDGEKWDAYSNHKR